MPLRIAAKVSRDDQDYFYDSIEPMLQLGDTELIGEIGEKDKPEFLGNAAALLFPIDWPEPFGLAMIEAMACGTPVIAWRNGSVPEVIAHGRSGYVVDSVADAVSAVGQLDRISRAGVRAHFDNHFTVTRMASQYVGVYARLLAMPKVTTAARVVPLKGGVAPATIRRELRVASLMTGKATSPRGTSID